MLFSSLSLMSLLWGHSWESIETRGGGQPAFKNIVTRVWSLGRLGHEPQIPCSAVFLFRNHSCCSSQAGWRTSDSSTCSRQPHPPCFSLLSLLLFSNFDVVELARCPRVPQPVNYEIFLFFLFLFSPGRQCLFFCQSEIWEKKRRFRNTYQRNATQEIYKSFLMSGDDRLRPGNKPS